MTRPAAREYEVRSYAEGVEFFHRRGWTDGNPIVLPTPDLVEGWLTELALDGQEILGTSDQRNRSVTVEQAVINSIMAGCRREYVPVVLAAIEAVLAPSFHHNHLASLGGPWPFFVVSGPIVDQIELNYDQYVLGPGTRANSTISRAISLTLWNCLEQRVGGVQRGAFGPSWRNECVIAERPDGPWSGLSEDRGFNSGANTITIFPATDFEQILVHLLDEPEHILAPIVDSLATGRFVWGPHILLLPPNMVAVFEQEGWSKFDVIRYIESNTQRSVAGLKRRTRWAEQQAGRRSWSDLLDVDEGEEDEMIPLFFLKDDYYDIAFRDKFLDSREPEMIVVDSGGDSGPCAYLLLPYTETGPTTVTIEITRGVVSDSTGSDTR